MLALFETECGRLNQALEEQKALHDSVLTEAEAERDAAEERAQEAHSEAYLLRQRVRALESKLAATPAQPAVPIPAGLEGFEAWCEEHLAGSVVLHPRALQGIRRSQYEDVQLIYRALLLLKDQYVPMRLDSSDTNRAAYQNALRTLHLEESLTGVGAKSNDDQYLVRYGGRRRPLDRHLKAGTSRGPPPFFRLYFFWSDDDGVVVVGWLPSHLDNRMT